MKTGDILLFRGRSPLSVLTRTVTLSKYDHIALIIKPPERAGFGKGDRAQIVEVFGDTGATIESFRLWISLNGHGAWAVIKLRTLVPPLGPSDQEKIIEFCKGLKNRQYSAAVAKVLRRFSVQPESYEDVLKREEEEKRMASARSPKRGRQSASQELGKAAVVTINGAPQIAVAPPPPRRVFCSEIVALAYKSLGILRSDLTAAAYMPGAFSQKEGTFILLFFPFQARAADYLCVFLFLFHVFVVC